MPDYAKFFIATWDEEITVTETQIKKGKLSGKNPGFLDKILVELEATEEQIDFTKKMLPRVREIRNQTKSDIHALIRARNSIMRWSYKGYKVNEGFISHFNPLQVIKYFSLTSSERYWKSYSLHDLWDIPTKPIVRDENDEDDDALTVSEDDMY